MTTVPDLPSHRRALHAVDDVVAAVPGDAWDRPSPCDGWTAADVLGHLATGQTALAGLAAGRARPTPGSAPEPPRHVLGADPAAGWRAARDASLAGLAAGDLRRPVTTPSGTTTLADFLDRLAVVELLVHAWDLATAAGVDAALPADLVVSATEQVHRSAAVLRGPRRYAAEVPWDGEHPVDRLVAFLGRRPATRRPATRLARVPAGTP
ncbi:TIGR03086 family metal-binding protein [Geodermatophilus sp. URMC 63]